MKRVYAFENEVHLHHQKQIMKKKLIITMLGCMALGAVQAKEAPNVIVIFTDDLGYGDVGCYGATKVKTPNIDQLAKDGKRFTDAHSASAVCTPSRYALMTGDYPIRAEGGQGIWSPRGLAPMMIDTEDFTIADAFKQKGYATACVGKWHLGFGTERNLDYTQPLSPGPNDVGFDYYFGMPVVNSSPPYVYVENDKIVGGVEDDPLYVIPRDQVSENKMPVLPVGASTRVPNRFNGAKKAHELFVEEEVAEMFTKKSVEWIEANKENPFFLYLATTHIHHPFTPHKRFQGTSEIGLYGDFIHELDWMVGELVQALEQNGLTENTLILFTSDNGGMFNQGGQDAWAAGHAQNGELLGYKFGAWEGGHRVPFIVKWPGKITPATESDEVVCNVDFLATFASIIGAEVPTGEATDSEDMSQTFLSDAEGIGREELLIAPWRKSNLAVRKGKWLFIDAQGAGGFGGKSGHGFAGPAAVSFMGRVNSDINMETGWYKEDAAPAQLYDLEADVAQTTNLYHQYPEVVKELRALLDAEFPNREMPTKKAPGKK